MGLMEKVFVLLLGTFSVTTQQPTFFRNTYKGLRGFTPRSALSEGEMQAVYYHDQTVAVADLGANNELRDCDLIEVYEPSEAMEVLKNLSMTTKAQLVSFHEMTTLMRQCELLDKLQDDKKSTMHLDVHRGGNKQGLNPLTLLSGILPGTKWCGTGDIADNYHDLGQEAQIDRCCRTHDLCPVKVRAQQTRYNLTNYSIYTKSHCSCDEMLYHCLKTAYHPTADVMGHIYFNLVKVPCVEDVPKSKPDLMGPDRKFIPAKMSY